MHTLRPNGRRRFTHFPHLGRPPCRSGNSQPRKECLAAVLQIALPRRKLLRRFGYSRLAKNSSPPFYVRSAVFPTPSIKPTPPFYAFFTSNNPPKKEKRRGISATDTPLSPTPRSLQCGLYPTRPDSTRISRQSQRLFTNKNPLDKTRALSTLFGISD